MTIGNDDPHDVEGDALVGAILPEIATICGKHGPKTQLVTEQGTAYVCPKCDAEKFKIRGANSYQVGGAHYGLSELQHWDLVSLFGWDYFQGQIIKYVMRCKKKNGIQDLEKAAHYLEKYIEEIKAGRITLA